MHSAWLYAACAAMKYRLAGGTYRVIAEKLTEERAQAYADEKGISFERAMKKIQHVSDQDRLGRRDWPRFGGSAPGD